MISELFNPKTPNYKQLKESVLSFNFPWHWMETSVEDTKHEDTSIYENFGYYGHCFLGSPGGHGGRTLYSFPNSNFLEQVQDVIVEILKYNNIHPNIIFRLHANCVHPTKTGKPGFPHTDHEFTHKNILVYLTDTNSGHTIVGKDKFSGKEDEVIIFDGEHYHLPPTEGRRIVLVGTFL